MIRTLLRLTGFTLVTLAFTAWLAFTIGNIRPFEDTYGLSATFEDATGLLINDNVKVAGVVVGKVTGIRVEKGNAVVDFNVRDDVKLPDDTEVAVRWRNLLGQRYLYLFPGEAGTMLEGGGHLPLEQARPLVDIGELFNRLGPIVKAVDPAQANAFLVSFTGALQGNEALLGESIHDLSILTQTLGERDEAVGRLVGNLATLTEALAARDHQIRAVLDNLTTLATTFNAHTDVLERSATDLSAFSQTLGRLISENRPGIDRILTNLDLLVGTVDKRLTSLDATVAGLDDFSLSLYNASRYGEWLNQFIPCLTIDLGATEVASDDECESSAGAAGAASPSVNPVAQVLLHITGADAASHAGVSP